MDWLKPLYPKVRKVLQSTIPSYWSELGFMLGDLVKGPIMSEAVLPLASCQAVNGRTEDAVPVAAALLAAAICLRVFDDLEDQDRPGQLWEQVGVARAWNYAAALHILSFEILNKSRLHPQVIHKINQLFIEAFLRIAAGQDRDLAGITSTIEDYWSTIELKTAAAYAAACASGAMVGTKDPRLIEACHVYGHHVGLALQIFNDMGSIWQPDGTTDLRQDKITLPLLYGLQLHHPDRDELASLAEANDIATHAGRIKEILESIGTKEFLIWAALKEREQALQAISVCPNVEGRKALESFVTGIFGDIDQFMQGKTQDIQAQASSLLGGAQETRAYRSLALRLRSQLRNSQPTHFATERVEKPGAENSPSNSIHKLEDPPVQLEE